MIKRLWRYMVKLAKDKLLHLLLAGAATAVAIAVFKICGLEKMSCAYGWVVGFAVGFGKELYDEAKKGTSESGDWAADLFACTVVALYSLICMM